MVHRQLIIVKQRVTHGDLNSRSSGSVKTSTRPPPPPLRASGQRGLVHRRGDKGMWWSRIMTETPDESPSDVSDADAAVTVTRKH